MLRRFEAIIQSHVNPVSSAMPGAAAAATTQVELPGNGGTAAPARPLPPAPGTLGHPPVLSATAAARKKRRVRTLAYVTQRAGVALALQLQPIAHLHNLRVSPMIVFLLILCKKCLHDPTHQMLLQPHT